MSRAGSRGISRLLERFSGAVTRWSGTTPAFAMACLVIVLWALAGPLFDFSNTWQLVVNTGTTVVTFLMVFLIQRAQNKDAMAIQLKLNELVAALDGASNRLIDVEDLSEDELRVLRQHYEKLVIMSRQDSRLTVSHTIEEAEVRHARKHRE